jgi:tetratricopeptide (TPR) repeat protein
MADDATTHHPAKEREDLLSDYVFRAYRTIRPAQPTPLPWAPDSRSPLKPQLTSLFAHYTDAENAAAYIADANQGTAAGAQSQVARATGAPTGNHAYTEFVAAEYYQGRGQAPQSEAALVKAVSGPEPSWEVYSRLTDIYIARGDYARAQGLMDQAVIRFENSPVLYPKRIEVYRASGDLGNAKALVPQCKAADIDELYDACKKANGG